MRRIAALVLVALVIAVAAFLWTRPAPRRHAPTIALWYWHTPFAIPPSERKELRRSKIDTLYVRAATIASGEAPRLILPQSWKTSSGDLKVHLVFRFDPGMTRMLDDSNPTTLGKKLSGLILGEVARARAAQINVAGVQLDMDCPTRMLTSLAQAAAEIKSALGGLRLSVTALPTWYTSEKVVALAGAVDFMVPQFYENSLGSTIDRVRPISSLSAIQQTLDAAARTAKPFMAGLPAYGRALLYDETGRLAGIQNDISARESLKHPSFEFVRSFAADEEGREATAATFCGEEVLDLIANAPAPNGRGKGYHLVYLIPSPELVRRHLRMMRQASSGCEGVILFRYPEAGELSTIPFQSLMAAIRGEATQPNIHIEASLRSDPLSSVGDQAAGALTAVSIYARNDGNGSTSVHPEALVLTLQLDRAGLEDAMAEEADVITVGTSSRGVFERSNPERADTLRLTRFHLAAGERVKLLTLRLRGRRTVSGTWSARTPGGFKKLSGGMTPLQVMTRG